MASRALLPLLRRPFLLPTFRLTPTATAACATTLLVAGPLTLAHAFHRPTLLDSFAAAQPSGASAAYSSSSRRDVKAGGVRWDAKAVRQASAGSVAGLLGGVVISFFSKPLALLIGLLIVGAQVLESKGIHIVPYDRIRGYIGGVNVKSALQKNVAFKLSFGVTFALAAFAKF